VFEIRVERVKAALKWLKENNFLYRDIEIDFQFFEDWVGEDDEIHVVEEGAFDLDLDDIKDSDSLFDELDELDNNISFTLPSPFSTGPGCGMRPKSGWHKDFNSKVISTIFKTLPH
jgi:hypothetical protein